MDWHIAVGIVSGVVQVASVVPYVRDMLRGTTRPNIVSWSLFTLLQVIAVAAQLVAGASWSVLFLIAMTFNTSLVTILAVRGYGYTKYGLVDWSCLALALVAIVLWLITNEPIVAIALAILADLMALTPTIVKTYREPQTESAISWFMVTVAAILAVTSTTKFDLANLLFPVYIIIGTGIVAGLAFFGQRLISKPLA